MKIEILQENLVKGLNIVSHAVSSKASLPILRNILLSAQNGSLKLTATNLEIGINIWLSAKIDKSGSFTVPVKDILEFITTINPGKIVINVEQEKLFLKTDRTKAVFNGMASLEYPAVPSIKEKSKAFNKCQLIKIPISKLIKAINLTAFSAATDESRPVLTGIRLSFVGKKLQFVATDGYRLSLKEIALDKSLTLPPLIIPAQALKEVVRILTGFDKDNEEEVTLAVSLEAKQIIFCLPEIEIIARLIEGEYPAFEKIIPQKGQTKAILDKEQFWQAVKASSIFARKSANIIRFHMANSLLVLTANAPEVGENEIKLEVKFSGEEVKIAFNYRFLQEFLGNLEEENLTIELSGPLKPGLFKTEKETDFLHVIMPVRLQEAEE